MGRVSAYFLNHNCLAFGEKSFVYLHSVLMVVFLEEQSEQRATTLTENLRQQLRAKGSFAVVILSGKNTLLTKY